MALGAWEEIGAGLFWGEEEPYIHHLLGRGSGLGEPVFHLHTRFNATAPLNDLSPIQISVATLVHCRSCCGFRTVRSKRNKGSLSPSI